MLKQNADWWKPKRLSRAWHLGHAARLSGQHWKNDNPYRGPEDSLRDFFAWKDGYSAACKECCDEHERILEQSPGYCEDIEFLTMRAYWQGVHWDTERFTNSDENPYRSAAEPLQEFIDAWDQGRHDA